jgi:hypothetical protein
MANTLKFGNGQWATKVGSTLAYNDENGNFKPLPFNFTRSTGGTRVNKDGLIEMVTNNKPRIDFLNDSNGALLLEPQRSNLITYSEDYSQSEWTNVSYTKDASITYNSASVAPDGTLGVYQYECTVSGTNSQLGAVRAISYGVAYSNSVYLRRITGTGIVKLRGVNNGEIDVTSELTSSWKRFEITQTSNSTNGRFYINALVSGDVIEVWGAQLEAGSYATSYIPTQGAISTKVADVCSQTPQVGVIGQTEGVIYLQVGLINNNNSTNATKWFMEIRKDANNSFGIGSGGADVAPTIRFVTKISGVASTDAEPAGFSNSKIAIQYTSSNFKIYQNGSLKATINKNIGNYSEIEFMQGAAVDLKMPIKDFRVYNTVLTDAELIALTT